MSLVGAGGQGPSWPSAAADRLPALHRLLGPQRVFDLQQNLGSVNVSTGCAPALQAQTPGLGPRGLQATARKVGTPGVSRQSWGGWKGGPCVGSPCIHRPRPQASRRSRQPTRHPACMLPPHLRTTRDSYQFGGSLSSHLEFVGILARHRNW